MSTLFFCSVLLQFFCIAPFFFLFFVLINPFFFCCGLLLFFFFFVLVLLLRLFILVSIYTQAGFQHLLFLINDTLHKFPRLLLYLGVPVIHRCYHVRQSLVIDFQAFQNQLVHVFQLSTLHQTRKAFLLPVLFDNRCILHKIMRQVSTLPNSLANFHQFLLFFFSLSLFSLSLSVCLCLSVALSISFSFISHCLSLSLFFSLSLCLSRSFSLSLSFLSLCLFYHVLSLYLSLSFSSSLSSPPLSISIKIT